MAEIITYHYVRPRHDVEFPGLHVRSLDEFDNQLATLANGQPQSLSGLIRALRQSEPVSQNTFVLTFDDGFGDHYHHVYPRLAARAISGAFFPAAAAVLNRQLLDVHKIQFMLATGADPESLRVDAIDFLKGEGCDELVHHLDPDDATTTGARFDNPTVRSLKRSLQASLPNPIRSATVEYLFDNVVETDSGSLAEELYLNIAQLQEMAQNGMEIGGHSVNHHHMDVLSDSELKTEIDGSVELLTAVYGSIREDWTFCYPYGSHDERVSAAVSEGGFASAVSVIEQPITPGVDLMAIPRIDTNRLSRDLVPGAP